MRASRRLGGGVALAVRWLILGVAVYAGSCMLALMTVRVVDPPLTAVQAQRLFEDWPSSGDPQRRHETVPLGRISVHLQHAVVAAEDTRFYRHRGIDWQALREALEDNLHRGRLWRGGSTITQQLVKNLFLTTHSSVLRKVVEMPLARLAETVLPKRRILELYLNVVEWGPGVFGAEAAARYHYGVPAAALTRDQAARLAACLPDPRRRDPDEMNHLAGVIERRMTTLGW
jgi:monofunctional biosynthetic peptidoglycan transglycosylase